MTITKIETRHKSFAGSNTMKYLLLLVALFFIGCSTIQSISTETIQKLPIVRVGDPAPQGDEYIVYYPTGYLFTLELQTKGSLFASKKKIQTQIALDKELYLYKYWASHDGISWKNSHELLDVSFEGGFDISGLAVHITLEKKE